MNEINFFSKEDSKPICSGTGLIALDVIINSHNKNDPFFMTGGSCGNVLIILSYLGWHSVPIGRLKKGNISKFILNDMKNWCVDTSFLDFDNKATTPIIIEKVKKNGNGNATHTFSFFCPECQSFLPRYRPVTVKQMDSIVRNFPHSDVCYIDRVSGGALKYGKMCKENGSIVFFEPTKIKDDKQFASILEITDILKYSGDIPIIDNKIVQESNIPIIIETHGSSGV